MNHSLTHLSSGQFAKLMGVSKDTLFHYDRLGILSPEIKADNGYRYYSMNQMDVFKVITILKELDMPLKEIRVYLDRRSPEELITLLEKEEQLLDVKIEKLNKMKKVISEKKQITASALKINPAYIGLKDMSQEALVITEADPYTNDESFYESMLKHDKYLDIHNLDASHTVGWMRDTKAVLANEAFNYDYLYTRISKDSTDANFIKENGTYLIAYHTDGYSSVEKTYDRMLKHCEREGLKLLGFFYEDVLLDDLSVRGYEQYTIKISVRISK
ncbi:MerR family transcriptional regulator [Paenibacillus sp. SZ31]|uniref:MerR family transcriptional regulator n=1 Tax=Paenibacillus sp. SZ31 TaxID=2725555 RepID=UPI00146BB37A|nr:MerR family transcriptional regulator [Paenibacillus sp. SZ31]NMI03589.1 MerR family transcriptional regulator [Paenibacillus sp. SZ31]